MAALGGGGATPPPAGAGTAPGQPPFGAGPMTPPVPPQGLSAEGASLVANAKQLLEAAISKPGLGAETKLGQAILKALEAIGRELPEGTVTPGQVDAGMQKFLLHARQTNPMQALAAAIGGPGGAPPGMPPGGAPPLPGGAPPVPAPPPM